MIDNVYLKVVFLSFRCVSGPCKEDTPDLLYAGGDLPDTLRSVMAVECFAGTVVPDDQGSERLVLCGEYQSELGVVYQLPGIGGEAVIGIIPFSVPQVDPAQKASALFAAESLDAGTGDVVDGKVEFRSTAVRAVPAEVIQIESVELF